MRDKTLAIWQRRECPACEAAALVQADTLTTDEHFLIVYTCAACGAETTLALTPTTYIVDELPIGAAMPVAANAL